MDYITGITLFPDRKNPTTQPIYNHGYEATRIFRLIRCTPGRYKVYNISYGNMTKHMAGIA